MIIQPCDSHEEAVQLYKKLEPHFHCYVKFHGPLHRLRCCVFIGESKTMKVLDKCQTYEHHWDDRIDALRYMFAAFNKKKTMKPKYEIDQTVYLTNGQPQTIYGVTKQSCGGFMYHVQECKHPRDEDELCPTPPADDLDKQIVNTQARLLKELVNGLPTYQIHEISNLIDLKIKKALLK